MTSGEAYLLGGALSALICYYLAQHKNREPKPWAIAGFFFSGITIILLIFSPKLEDSSSNKLGKF